MVRYATKSAIPSRVNVFPTLDFSPAGKAAQGKAIHKPIIAVLFANENCTYIYSSLPGNSKKLEVRLCRPRAHAVKFSGPISSLDAFETLDRIDSREPRRDARYASPPKK